MATLSKSPLPAGRRIRVLVVDDSVVARRILSAAIESDSSLELVGSAGNGVIALQRLEQVNPDVITLDIEMPEMDGIETLRRIRASRPRLPVIMCSSLTERGAAITIDALLAGANDYITKDLRAGYASDPREGFRLELLAKIKQFFTVAPPPPQPNVAGAGAETSMLATVSAHPILRSSSIAREVLAIGVSTGGPNALTEILPAIPAAFRLPILIVQHMPPIFTKLLAARLDTLCKIRVEEAADGRLLEPGLALIAPGDYHMKLKRVGGAVRVVLNQGARENSCRPAVDVTLRSVHEMYQGAAIAVILTGMGQDGLRGIEILKPAGASVLVQDEASSVVWGMPGFVARAGLADRILPLCEIVPEILAIQNAGKTRGS
jgi:two-component system, chemotaxis family, protein-glutamate methylesterase/glutaminase